MKIDMSYRACRNAMEEAFKTLPYPTVIVDCLERLIEMKCGLPIHCKEPMNTPRDSLIQAIYTAAAMLEDSGSEPAESEKAARELLRGALADRTCNITYSKPMRAEAVFSYSQGDKALFPGNDPKSRAYK